jgi:hypothetical protein
MRKLILVSLFLFFRLITFGDALPHGYQSYKFESAARIDSIIVIESNNTNFRKIDTVFFNPNFKIVQCKNNNCRTNGYGSRKYQQLIIYIDGFEYRSNIYEPLGSNPTFLVKEYKARFMVIETTSFLFKGRLGEILRALLITIILELIVALFFFRIRNNSRVFIAIILINLVTIPLAWITFPLILNLWDSAILLTLIFEVLIIIIEYLGLRFLLKTFSNTKILRFTMIGNLVSFIFGGILYVFTIFI